jgi:hypothetical protein
MPLLPSCPASYIVLKVTAFYVRIGYGICVDRQTSRRDAQARPDAARYCGPLHAWNLGRAQQNRVARRSQVEDSGRKQAVQGRGACRRTSSPAARLITAFARQRRHPHDKSIQELDADLRALLRCDICMRLEAY